MFFMYTGFALVCGWTCCTCVCTGLHAFGGMYAYKFGWLLYNIERSVFCTCLFYLYKFIEASIVGAVSGIFF